MPEEAIRNGDHQAGTDVDSSVVLATPSNSTAETSTTGIEVSQLVKPFFLQVQNNRPPSNIGLWSRRLKSVSSYLSEVQAMIQSSAASSILTEVNNTTKRCPMSGVYPVRMVPSFPWTAAMFVSSLICAMLLCK